MRSIADGAAMMTGTTVEAKVYSGVSNLVGNRPLEEVMQHEFENLVRCLLRQMMSALLMTFAKP